MEHGKAWMPAMFSVDRLLVIAGEYVQVTPEMLEYLRRESASRRISVERVYLDDRAAEAEAMQPRPERLIEARVIDSLDSDAVKIKRPFAAILVKYEDSDHFVARLPGVNISASGEAPDEAFASLKAAIVAKFLHYSTYDAQKLGLEPKRQLEALSQFLRKR
jgi:hypothetical protein